MNENLTDEELLELSKNGKENAENLLLERYKDLVVKIARSYFIVGGELEDIVQEGMIGLYKAIKNFSKDKKTTFKTFAITCIKHQIQSAIKTANTKKNSPLANSVSLQSFSEKDDDSDDFLPVNLIFQVPPDERVIDRENYESLIEIIKKALSKKEYEVLKYYLSGYSYKEISKILDINEKSIDNSLSRIKTKLKSLIKKWFLKHFLPRFYWLFNT